MVSIDGVGFVPEPFNGRNTMQRRAFGSKKFENDDDCRNFSDDQMIMRM